MLEKSLIFLGKNLHCKRPFLLLLGPVGVGTGLLPRPAEAASRRIRARRYTSVEPWLGMALGTGKQGVPGSWYIILLMAEIRRSPVEVGSLSHYFLGFHTSQVVQDFSHQQ